MDDGTPGAMIIIAFLVLSVGLASCSMKRLGSVPLLSARRRPAATQNPTPVAYSFISHPFTNAHARSCSRRKPAATSPGRRTASRRSVPCSAPRRRPCPPRVSSRSCRRWPRTRPSAGARRRRRRSRAAGAGAGPSWLQDKRSFSLKRPREEGAGVEARASNKKGKSLPKKGKSPAQVRYDQKRLLLYQKKKANNNQQKKANNKANKNAGGKSNKGVKKSPRIAAKKKSRGGWATE